ncbi:MAG: hypothetical protein ACE14M_05345 [Terriglobales bacterium]
MANPASPSELALGGTPEFRDPAAALANLERIRQRVPVGVGRAVVPLLAESPDPDSALNLFERLTSTGNAELFRMFDRYHFLLHYALLVFGYSQYLGETLIQNPDLFHSLLREKSLDLSRSREELQEAFARFRSRSLETNVSLLLARFKRREYVRIMLRDVLGIATLADTTAEISALTDVLIEEALREAGALLRERYGPAQHLDKDGRLVDTPFAVLSLGKHGGKELNYSSDIDLLYLYGDGPEPPEAPLSNREYFIRLGQQLTEILSRVTPEGAPFRIDLRLRPQGGEGEPAVGLSHAFEYYANRAHDWELQAMIKVRYSAGNQALAREFIRRVQPYIYTPQQLNFAAIETALETREKIGRHRQNSVSRKAGSIDVKLDRGGIRDIEFLVQCLQRVYGGTELWLRSGGTLFSLQKLHDKEHITGKEFHDLTTAYEFLRTVEHRLQLRHGQQTHRLPHSPHELRVLARMVTGERGARPEDLVQTLRDRMAAVAEIYNRIIHHQQVQQQRDDAEFRLRASDSREEAHRQLLERLAVDSPALYEIVQSHEMDAHARRNLYRFLTSAFTSSERYAAILDAPQAVARALELFAFSDYLTDILVRYPEEIATVAEIVSIRHRDTADLFPAEAVCGGGAESDPVFEYLARSEEPYTDKLALLRRHYRTRVFAASARDVMESRPVYESLAETTAAADDAIRAALAIAGRPHGFAIMALGRLGAQESDLLSDADLLFLREPSTESRDGARIVERLVEILSAYTRDGTVFPVDTRLRPHGAEGELVLTPAQLRGYFAKEAQAWEALTYTKLRFIAGERNLAEEALAAVTELHQRFAQNPGFRDEVREMRAKLEKSEEAKDNFKIAPGGLYDIDFIAGELLVRHGVDGSAGNLRQRLHGLQRRGLLPARECQVLDSAAEFLRALEHVIRLVMGRARKTLPVAGQALQATETLLSRILRRKFQNGLEHELIRIMTEVRKIYLTPLI